MKTLVNFSEWILILWRPPVVDDIALLMMLFRSSSNTTERMIDDRLFELSMAVFFCMENIGLGEMMVMY